MHTNKFWNPYKTLIHTCMQSQHPASLHHTLPPHHWNHQRQQGNLHRVNEHVQLLSLTTWNTLGQKAAQNCTNDRPGLCNKRLVCLQDRTTTKWQSGYTYCWCHLTIQCGTPGNLWSSTRSLPNFRREKVKVNCYCIGYFTTNLIANNSHLACS